MKRATFLRLGTACVAIALLAVAIPLATGHADSPPQKMPAPATDVSGVSGATGLQTAVFAGGCFWGIQGVFQHVRGVTQAVSGYAGGKAETADYMRVSNGDTGHAESVKVTFDPARVSYGTLLQVFFSVALDPTQVDRQGPDWGTQYRSELFVADPEQERVARAYVAQIEAAHLFSAPIATRIEPGIPFYPAEAYHQDYLELHPGNPYIAINDIPKVRALQKLFPAQWQATPRTVNKLPAAS